MWSSDSKTMRRISKICRAVFTRQFLHRQLSTAVICLPRQKLLSVIGIVAFLSIVLFTPVKAVHAGPGLNRGIVPVSMRQALTPTPSATGNTPQPPSTIETGRPVRITTGLILLFVVGLFIALAMAGIGLVLGFWMKRHDKH